MYHTTHDGPGQERSGSYCMYMYPCYQAESVNPGRRLASYTYTLATATIHVEYTACSGNGPSNIVGYTYPHVHVSSHQRAKHPGRIARYVYV